MKVRTLLLFILVACAPTVYSFGQLDCTPSSSNYSKLACQFPVSAQGLVVNTVGYSSNQISTTRAYQGASVAAAPINGAVATQLTQLPIPSATIGVVSLRQKGSDVPTPFDNLGPILTDRPDTVGKGHFFVGFSYQHFNFNGLDGQPLSNLLASFSFQQTSFLNQNDTQTFYGSERNDIAFKLDQYVGVLTYGLGKRTDISVVVPINSVSLNMTSSSFQASVYDSSSNTITSLNPPAGAKSTTTGSASGVGDLIVTAKQLLVGDQGSRTAVSAGSSLRVKTGDPYNYLGSGATGLNAFGLFEYRARLAPHLKVSYQWNSPSQLVKTSAGTKTQLPGGVQYAGGADYRIVRSLTFAGDFLGAQFVNAPSFSLTTPAASSSVPSNFTAVTALNNTYTTASVSAGFKWTPARHVMLYANVLKQMNNVGLRSDLVPLFGIAYKR